MSAPLGASYRRLWTASALSNLADGVFQIALPLLTLDLTRSPAAVAGVALAGRLPWLIWSLPAGALADRLDRRRTMVRIDLARVAALGALAVLVALDAATLPLLYVVAFALGGAETMFDTAAQSVMPAIVPTADLSRANGRLYAAELTMNQFVGPAVGGLLVAAAAASAFGTSAACYLVAGAALAAMRGSFRPVRDGTPTRLSADIVEGLRYLAHHRLLRTLGFMVGVMNLGSTATFAVMPLYAVDPGPMGLSKAGFGVFMTTLAIGSLLGSLAADRLERRLGRARVLGVTVLGCGLAAAVPALTAEPALVAIGFAATGLFVVSWNVVTVSLRQRIVPDRLLGRVNAGYRLLAWGTMPLGALLGAVIGELVGLRAVFAVNAVSTLLLLLCRAVVTDDAIDAAENEAENEAGEAQLVR